VSVDLPSTFGENAGRPLPVWRACNNGLSGLFGRPAWIGFPRFQTLRNFGKGLQLFGGKTVLDCFDYLRELCARWIYCVDWKTVVVSL
jgi:hypothetical protein